MTSRSDQARAFIAQSGWADATVATLAGDASNRRYDRLTRPDGQSAVLMDADPNKGEDVRPFVRIAEYLTSQGLSAPQILSADAASGFLLIEDLGDRLYAREVLDNPTAERSLYEAAVDVLSHLHKAKPPALLNYYDTVVRY